jgi:hypothetical protein
MKPEPGLRTGKTHNMRLAYRESCLEKKNTSIKSFYYPQRRKEILFCFSRSVIINPLLSLACRVYTPAVKHWRFS